MAVRSTSRATDRRASAGCLPHTGRRASADRPSRANRASVLAWAALPTLAVAAGVLALLDAGAAAIDVSVARSALLAGVALPAACITAMRLRGRSGAVGALIALAMNVALAYLARDAFVPQLERVAYSAWMGGVPWREGLFGMDASLVAAPAAALCSLALYGSLSVAPLGWLARVGFIALACAESAVGLDSSLQQLAYVTFFLVAGVIAQQVMRASGHRAPTCADGHVALAGLAVALVAALATPALFSCLQNTPVLARTVAQASRVTDRVRRMVMGGRQLAAGATESLGAVSRGNNYANGTSWLNVQLLAEPQETVYLKQFTGGAYVGDAWAEDENGLADYLVEHPARDSDGTGVTLLEARNLQSDALEAALLGDDAALASGQSMGWGSSAYVISGASEAYRAHTIAVERIEGGDQPVPYYSHGVPGAAGTLTYTFFSPAEALAVPWTLSASQQAVYQARLAVLERYARATYLDVPEELVPRLAALAAENPVDGGDALAAVDAVRQLLAERAAYTRTPGEATGSGDIVDEFLFTRHAGYCQQFASAATLLLRLYGVPARYACGYAAPARMFAQRTVSEEGALTGADKGLVALDGETGTDQRFEATLSDLQQHAWVEIFVENVGWVPVEVTPAAASSAAPEDEPAASVADAQADEERAAADAEEPAARENGQADSVDAAGDKDGDADTADAGGPLAGLGAALEEVARWLARAWEQAAVRAAVSAAGAVAAACAGLAAWRMAVRRRVARLAPDGLLARMMHLLHRAGVARGCASGYELGFAQALGGELGGDVGAVGVVAAAQELVDLAAQAAFSQHGVSAAERAAALRRYRELGEVLVAHLARRRPPTARGVARNAGALLDRLAFCGYLRVIEGFSLARTTAER